MTENILTLWKKQFKKDKKAPFLWDNILWMQNKKDFAIKAYLISNYIKQIPWEYIGIMLPAVGSASLMIMSTYLANKTPVMFNWTLWKEGFDHCVNFSKVDKILTSSDFYENVKNDFLEEYAKAEKFVFVEDLLKDISIGNKIQALIKSLYMPIPRISKQAVILFTSGSESLPKAVPLSHTNLIEDIKGALEIFALSDQDRLLWFLPPFHSFGFTINTIMPLISGLEMVYTPDPNDAKTILEIIKHTKITAITATPTFLKMIMNLADMNDLSSVRYAVVGAEKCPQAVADRFKELCPKGKILEGYGITECSPVVSINPIDWPKLWSVGKVIWCLDCKIIGLDSQKEWAIGEQWMIYIEWPSIFEGYLDEKIESPFEEIDGKEYYKTGDLGYLDKDWYLYITGRLKRFIKIAGEMISLPFVEWVLLEEFGDDKELKIAIEALEKDGNAKIVLFSIEHLEVEIVNDYLRKRWVSNLIKVSDIIKIAEIPVLGTGKTDYKELKKLISF